VEQSNNLSALLRFIKTLNIETSKKQENQLRDYLNLLYEYSINHRIISSSDKEFIVEKHFSSSLVFVQEFIEKVKEEDAILDIGSGGGFPGIILSIYFPEIKTICVDSIRKKTLFLSKVVRQLNLNCEVINERIESYLSNNQPIFNFITARALASIDELIELTKAQSGKTLFTLKGTNYHEEVKELKTLDKLTVKPVSSKWLNYTDYLKDKIFVQIQL
jgi:16S rRNA (guanine527-N7)-methyltransferase